MSECSVFSFSCCSRAPPAQCTMHFGTPVVLNVPAIGFGHFGTQYDVSPDGQRIYFLDRTREPAPREISFVMGWQALLGTNQIR